MLSTSYEDSINVYYFIAQVKYRLSQALHIIRVVYTNIPNM